MLLLPAVMSKLKLTNLLVLLLLCSGLMSSGFLADIPCLGIYNLGIRLYFSIYLVLLLWLFCLPDTLCPDITESLVAFRTLLSFFEVI